VIAVSTASAELPFEIVFAREYPAVVRIAYRVLGDRADAEDVAQDLFVRFVGRRLPDAPVLHLAAVRRALNLLRSRRRQTLREMAECRSRAVLDKSEGRSDDPFYALNRATRQSLVRSTLSRLARRDAEILALRYSGASYRDIAQTLRIESTHVGTRIARAERAFRSEIERATKR
jgi:RNA polymerase sigma-70 factor (ECF subfamily)